MNELLKEKIINKKAIINVIGLGYVGLPLALSFAESGYKVNGIDIDKNKIKNLNNQTSYISDVKNNYLKNTILEKKMAFNTNYNSISESDVIIICVPTPLNKTKDPDISYIVAVVEEIAKYSIKEKLVCLESTVYPGATEEIVLPKLSTNPKLTIGKDFNLIFSPERIDPGQTKWNLENTPKVIGGITSECTELGSILYQAISKKIIKVSSTRAAEMTKLLENTFRAANIGLINEMAIICEKLEIDIWEIIEAAKTKPYGFMPFFPGPGLGGHCIPVDPRYLDWKLQTLNSESKYIKLSEEINFSMPHYVLSRIKNIKEKNKLKNNPLIVFGVSYKPNVSDIRESPAIDLLKLFYEENIDFIYNDPYVKKLNIDGRIYHSEPLSEKLLQESDLGIITTDHSNYNWKDITNNLSYIFDTRNALRNTKAKKSKIYKL